MKFLPTIAMIIVQQLAMIFFMRIARWDLFLSAGSAAFVAMTMAFIIYFVQRRGPSRHKSV
jgi:hypothetical protein